jgi:drug/metabolite transporter (DMT)-like permease
MLGIALGLGSSVAWGISDFLGGLQTRRASALGVMLVTQPVGLVLALGVALVFGGDALSTQDAAYAVGAGVVGVVALGAFYRAMALGSVSVVATIGALGIAVPVGAGIAGGDSPTWLQGLGAVMAFGGALLVAREPDAPPILAALRLQQLPRMRYRRRWPPLRMRWRGRSQAQ